MTSTTEEGRAFLQSRVALCWKAGTLISGGFLFVLFVAWLLTRGSALAEVAGPIALAALVGTVVSLVAWQTMRRATLGLWAIGLVEVVTGFVLLSVYALVLACVNTPPEWRPDLAMILITAFVTTVRSIAIPASVRPTLVSASVSAVPALALAGYLYWTRPLPAVHTSFAMAMMIATLLCAISVAIAGFAAKVIYGLRAEVAEAERLGQYVLERKLGEGGMGTVFLARHALLSRPTAVKLLFPERVGPEALARFEREVRLTATLTHPNTVGIFDYGRTPDGAFYYAMEYLDGVDLERLVKRFGPQPPSRVIHLLQQVCASLAEAHARGLVHRDVKPANIVLCERGGVPDMVKVVDFGLVKDLGSTGAALSRADTMLGTPLYMAPEAVRGARIDGRADLYALGAVGYFLLTGRPVFEAASPFEICSLHLTAQPEPPSVRLGARLPEDLEALLLACLSKDPVDRPAAAVDLRRALLACDVPLWTEDEARAWWAAHQDASHPGSEALEPTLPIESAD